MSYLEIARATIVAGRPASGHLLDLAAEIAPKVHFTVWETEDVDGNIAWLRQVKELIDTFPGSNKVYMRIHRLDSQIDWTEWRALATKDFRLRLGRLIAGRSEITKARIRQVLEEGLMPSALAAVLGQHQRI